VLPLKDLLTLATKYGLPAVLLAAVLYWVLITLTTRLDNLVAEQQVTNVRLMALCVNTAGGSPDRLMGCLATRDAPAK